MANLSVHLECSGLLTSCEVGPLLCTHFLDEDIQPYLSLEPEDNAHSYWLLFYWHSGDTEDQVLLP